MEDLPEYNLASERRRDVNDVNFLALSETLFAYTEKGISLG